MKESKYTFAEGFLGAEAKIATIRGNKQMAFDWDRAATIIKEKLIEHPDLEAEAGLNGDWKFTGGGIFRGGKPINNQYTFLSSCWAKPTLILSWNGQEQEEIICETEESERFTAKTKWDKDSITILGIKLQEDDTE